MGLLGSRFLAANPPVPKDKIVADVNTDMPTLIAPLLSVEPLGAKHSSLINEVNAAANFLGLEVQEDHIPDQVRFVRSDQYSFLREGIPALHIKYGLKTKSPSFICGSLLMIGLRLTTINLQMNFGMLHLTSVPLPRMSN